MLTYHFCCVTVMVETRPRVDLGFTADFWTVGLGIRGEVVLAEKDKPILHKYVMQGHGTCIHVWDQNLPQDIKSDCPKEVTPRGDVHLQQLDWERDEEGGDHPTVTLSADGQIVRRLQHKGELCGWVPPGSLAYRVGREGGEGGCDLVIVDNEGGERRVCAKPGHTWGAGLSVCGDDNGRVAVTDLDSSTLDIITHQQRKLYTIQH